MQQNIYSIAASQSRIAIVDIGSNSIRLVVYDQMRRAPAAMYNEKVMCQLGKGLAISGKLNPEGVVMARSAIARYLTLIKAMEVAELHVIATAAVRDAKDGEDFARSIEKEHNINVDIISGKREAKLGAYGILSSIYKPKGITGDLGGGSMELVQLDGMHIGNQVTLPIGPLRLIDETQGDIAAIERIVEKEFNGLEWLKNSRPPAFYAIGGSFRALAKMHMEMEKYPLNILHEYSAKPKSMLGFLKLVLSMNQQQLLGMPGVSAKRASAIPAAAVVLKSVIENTNTEEIIFSANGIREGFLYEKLSPFSREDDVLIASCKDFASKLGRNPDFAREMNKWMEQVLSKESEKNERIRLAFCLTYDIARYIHPEYRAIWSYNRMAQSSFQGLTHSERVQLALALYHRHQFRRKGELIGIDLIGGKEKAWALLVGSLANLAYHLTGGIAGTLAEIKLEINKSAILLKMPKHLENLLGENIRKKLANVEEAYLLTL